MLVRVIFHSQRDRIHFQCPGQFVHRAFERVSAGTFARRAHERRRRDIHRVNRFLDPDRRTLIHQSGRTRAARFRELPDRRSERLAHVLDRLQLSVARRGERKSLARRRAMAGADKHIPARDVHFDRNARDLCAHRREQDVHPDRALAAERAADERADDSHVFELESERVRQDVLHAFHKLRRIVKRELLSDSQCAIVPDISIGLCVSVGVM